MNEVKLPAGRYVLSDPCYVLDDDYDDALEGLFNGSGEVNINGQRGAIFWTKYGDGCYASSEGHMLGVDAGCIALLPASIAEGDTNVTMDSEFTCRNDNGVLWFGNISVNTK